jgi:SAM-dependent methyltransferase
MSTGLSLARQAAEPEAPPAGALVRYGGAGETGHAMALRLVGEGKRVLTLGGSATLLGDLREQGCEVVAAPAADGRLDLPADAAGDGFDVVVAVDVLEHLGDPLAALQAVRAHLRREGYLVAAAPNVAHGNVRLALLAGRSPFGEGGLTDAHRRFFTFESLVGLVEKAGFAIGTVARQEEDITLPDGAPDSVADLLDTVAGAPEARTWRFLVVAYPLPWPGLDWLQERLRGLAEQYVAARREADDLREDLEAVNGHLHLLLEQQQASLAREKDLRARLLEAHDRLLTRDEELRNLHQSAQEQLLQRDRHVRELEEQWGNLNARLDRFRRTPLLLAYRVLRRVKRSLVRR